MPLRPEVGRLVPVLVCVLKHPADCAARHIDVPCQLRRAYPFYPVRLPACEVQYLRPMRPIRPVPKPCQAVERPPGGARVYLTALRGDRPQGEVLRVCGLQGSEWQRGHTRGVARAAADVWATDGDSGVPAAAVGELQVLGSCSAGKILMMLRWSASGSSGSGGRDGRRDRDGSNQAASGLGNSGRLIVRR